MDTLMIVEDEEQVRNDLVSLIKRSNVKIEQILECGNGQEALKLLQEKMIDVIFTDIHMPGMSGCELAGEIAGMEMPGMKSRPKVVIVSGFEDFQCAVELLKYGAKDYILKPASFEAVNDVLQRMEIELNREKKRMLEIDRIYRQHVRNLLKSGENEHEEAWEILNSVFEDQNIQDIEYRLILTNPSEKIFPEPYKFFLDRVNGDLYFIEECNLEKWKNAHQENFCMGMSQMHTSVHEISAAYKEALEARKTAFIKCTEIEIYEPAKWLDSPEVNLEADRFLQQFPTDKTENARKRFRNFCFEAKHQRISPLVLVELAELIVKRLMKNYESVYSKKTGGKDCPIPLDNLNMDAFMEELDLWIAGCQKALTEHADTSRKNDKIRQAVEYIHENYQKDLNLAMVSNHVSMNYSMFSNAFKKYTGVNFVNYLKDIRIREARILLEETDKKIAEIGACVGYGNDKHFMKTFKAICGVSPSEYRRNVEMMKRNNKLMKKRN